MNQHIMSCSVIIVDYGTMKRTAKFIEDFTNNCEDRNECHYIIVDNYSTDEGLMFLENNYGNPDRIDTVLSVELYKFFSPFGFIIYCRSGENLGYAKGNNLGTYIADELFNDKYYLISNNDIVFKNYFSLSEFERIFAEYPTVAVLGPRVLSMDGKDQSPRKKVGIFKYMIAGCWLGEWPFYWRSDFDYTNESKFCYAVVGCFLLIEAEKFREINRYDPHTFMYAEEMILSEKLNNKGYCCYFYNEYAVVHEEGATVSKAANSHSGEWNLESCCYFYEYYRNTPSFLITMVRLNFKIYKVFLSFKRLMRRMIKHSE